MSNRHAASLTESLLVRKGAAAPSPFGREDRIAAPSPRRFISDAPPKTSRGAPSSTRRFTLRLSDDQHLRLRLASVHLGQSGQKLVLQAVNEYLSRIAPELHEGNCACFLDGAPASPPRGKEKPAR